MTLHLITIPVSHYCERARWALDLAGLDYHESQHVPPFHARQSKRAGGKHSLPVLITDQGSLTDSGEIVRFAAERGAPLYPEGLDRGEIDELSDELAGRFGAETRRVAYFYFLPDSALVARYTGGLAPAYQRLTARLAWPVFRKKYQQFMKIYPKQVEAGIEYIETVFDDLDRRLADGRQYLCGSAFSAADLTFASLAAPVIGPTRYGAKLPPIDALAAEHRQLIERLRARPAGQLALRLYDQRPPSPLWPQLGVQLD